MNKLIKPSINSILTQTHITSICFYENYLIFAYGSTIEIRHLNDQNKFLQYHEVFRGCNVYRVKIFNRDCDKKPLFVAFGNRFFTLFQLSIESKLQLKILDKDVNLNDWILEARIQKQFLYCVLALNQLVIYDLTKHEIIIRITCPERCILYSACLMEIESQNKIRLAAGTVFTEILICDYTDSNNCEIKQRLKGHEGVLFTIDYSKKLNLLASASDDRTIRIWGYQNNQETEFQLLHTLYGHESRIWQVLLINDCIVSSGENSSLYFWSYDGQLLCKEKRKLASIWSICADKEEKNIYFAGTDGSIACKSILDCIMPNKKDFIDMKSVKNFQHAFKPFFSIINFADNLRTSEYVPFLLATDELAYWHKFDLSKDYERISTGFLGEDFKSYNVIAVHSNGCRVAVGSASGRLIEFNPRYPDAPLVDYGQVHKGKILKVLYVDNMLLSNGPNGEIKLWSSFKECQIIIFQMPKNICINCALKLENGFLIFGDRFGNIFVYNSNGTELAMFTNIHGKNGVKNIQAHPLQNQLFYSAGRDGRIIEYEVSALNQVNILRVFRDGINMDWISQMHFDPISGDLLYIVGFMSTVFVVWCDRRQAIFWSVDCGGGNRLWDFYFDRDQFCLVYWKDKKLQVCSKKINQLQMHFFKSKFHADTILASSFIFDSNYNKIHETPVFYVSGGEDNLAVIHYFDENNKQLIPCDTLFGHISSIKTLSTLILPCNLPSSNMSKSLLVTAGGRSQMMIWSIELQTNKSKKLRVKQLANHFLWNTDKQRRKPWVENLETVLDPQIRYTAIQLHKLSEKNDCFIITATCSDCTLKQFLFCITTLQMRFIQSIQLDEHCLLSLCRQDEFFFVGSTDGKVRFLINNELNKQQIDFLLLTAEQRYKKNPLEILIEPEGIASTACTLDNTKPLVMCGNLELHQSGVNTLDCILLSRTPHSRILLASGGDDTRICLSLCEIHKKSSIKLLTKNENKTAHWASIASVKLVRNDRLITCSSDNRVRLFAYSITNLTKPNIEIIPLHSIISSISDICSMSVTLCKNKEQATIAVFGEGQQLFQVFL